MVVVGTVTLFGGCGGTSGCCSMVTFLHYVYQIIPRVNLTDRKKTKGMFVSKLLLKFAENVIPRIKPFLRLFTILDGIQIPPRDCISYKLKEQLSKQYI